MQKLYTLSAYETTARTFFDRLTAENTSLVLDVRLNTASQLCGFTKDKDLAFFIPKLCGAAYVHDTMFAPAKEILDAYIHNRSSWQDYSDAYGYLMEQRNAWQSYQKKYAGFSCVCLLGTATRKRRSHSEILYELLRRNF